MTNLMVRGAEYWGFGRLVIGVGGAHAWGAVGVGALRAGDGTRRDLSPARERDGFGIGGGSGVVGRLGGFLCERGSIGW
jgi:hypothetical protein